MIASNPCHGTTKTHDNVGVWYGWIVGSHEDCVEYALVLSAIERDMQPMCGISHLINFRIELRRLKDVMPSLP
jgi:hypothetical protein